MYKFFASAVALVGLGIAGTANAAITITDADGSLAAFSYSVDETTRTITLNETWDRNTNDAVDLLIEGWTYGLQSWTINKYVTNNTGADWDWFSNELLQSDRAQSPDKDGMSFAQLGVPVVSRTSDRFASVEVNETGGEDYLKFFDGIVANGDTVYMQFGLTNRRDTDVTNPFYLRQLAPSVPEPATWAMLIAGFGMVGLSFRRRRRGLASVTA